MPHKTSTTPVLPTRRLEEFGVSQNGFLPQQLPLRRLSDVYYEPWEAIMDCLPTFIGANYLRSEVNAMEVLSTSRLGEEREWQRAYLVLSFLTHGYIWGDNRPSEVRALQHLPFESRH